MEGATFPVQLEKHILKRGRLTIPAFYVRMHNLQNFVQCVLIIEAKAYTMQMRAHGDKRKPAGRIDHVVMTGDFEWIRQHHHFEQDDWLLFTLIFDPDENFGEVAFNVAKFTP